MKIKCIWDAGKVTRCQKECMYHSNYCDSHDPMAHPWNYRTKNKPNNSSTQNLVIIMIFLLWYLWFLFG